MDEAILKNLTQEIKLLREELQLLRMQFGQEAADSATLHHRKSLVHHDVPHEIPIEERAPGDNPAIGYLNSKKIVVKNYNNEPQDDIFMKLSDYLGNRYSYLKEFYNIIKPSLSTGGSFYYNMQHKSQEVLAYCTQFCSMLHQNAFLSNYTYKKANKIITGTPQRVGKVINFFTGGWLENYIFNTTLDSIKFRNIKDFSYAQNCRIELSNGDDFEIDMIFMIKNTPVWIECKTGDYQRYISKYSDFRKKLCTKVEHSVLIVSDLPEGISKNLSSTFNLKVCDLNEGKKYIEELIESMQ